MVPNFKVHPKEKATPYYITLYYYITIFRYIRKIVVYNNFFVENKLSTFGIKIEKILENSLEIHQVSTNIILCLIAMYSWKCYCLTERSILCGNRKLTVKMDCFTP